MIPPFNEHGYLPAGIHRATLSEVAARFGDGSEVRRVQMDSVRWLFDLANRAGVDRLVVNGSFVTDVLEPNDVDCVLVNQADFSLSVDDFFATDRRARNKGLIEVIS